MSQDNEYDPRKSIVENLFRLGYKLVDAIARLTDAILKLIEELKRERASSFYRTRSRLEVRSDRSTRGHFDW